MSDAPAVRAQITAGPTESAALLLDLNDKDPLYVLHDGFTLGSASRGERRVTLTVRGLGASSEIPRAISEMMRAINRSESYFSWQALSSHAITWFRILDSVSEVDFQQTVTDRTRDPMWTLNVSLTVEELGYAERVTLPAFTLANANLGYSIPEDIEGDAPSLATVVIKPGSGQGWSTWENLLSVIAVHRSCPLGAPGAAGEVVAAPVPAVIQWEAEAFTLSGGATTTAAGTLSGGSGVVVDEQDASWRMILSGDAPVKPPPGRYTVMLGLSRPVNAGKVRFRFGPNSWGLQLTSDAPLYAPNAGAADASWLNVGDISFPSGQPYEGLTDADVTTPSIQLWAKGLAAGTAGATVVVDRIALIPIDMAQGGQARTLRAKWATIGPFGPGPLWNSWRIEGPYRRSGVITFDGRWFSTSEPPTPQGGFLLLHPGMRNIVTLLYKMHNATGGGVGSQLLSGTAEITISYHPRVRHLAAS